MGSAYRDPIVTINTNVGNVTDSYKNVWNNCEISVSDEKRQILEWLSTLAPRERHRAVSESRMDGVGGWLLGTDEFKKWHTGEDQGVHPVLFCYGDPGVGKTYLSSLVIDTLYNSIDKDNVAVASVYCDFHTHREQSAGGVLAALLKQLVAGAEPIPKVIREAFDRAKRVVDGRALRLPEICTMLIKSLESLQRGFICIDALDEFPSKNRPELWESLQHVVGECPNIRLFVTGRPHIRGEVGGYFSGYPNLAPVKPTEGDIAGYVTMRLKRDAARDAMDRELEAEILRIIPDKVSESFLLVSLVMDAVLEDATIHQRRQTLRRMTNGIGLDDAYSATLSRIREQKGNKGKLGMEALMWISHSERPLKAEELCHALAVEVGTTDLNFHNVPSIRALLSCTMGLVTVDEQASTVRFVHFTLQEYFSAHPTLFITPHSMMAEICLTYLHFQSICELSPTLGTVPATTPFLRYASCYWGFHAREVMTEGVKHLALRHLQRDANHISADILLREKTVDFLSWWDRFRGKRPDLRGFTGLHCISYIGITEVAIAMVDMKKWDVNGRDSNGATPLIWAAKYGNQALASVLLEQEDINPTLGDNGGRTPLAHAAKAGQKEMVKLLLERGDLNPGSSDKRGRTPLSYAAEGGHDGVVKIFLERRDVNPDSSDKDGLTPLSYAAQFGSEGVVKMLLQRGDINPYWSDKDGRTLLSYAAQSGSEVVVKIFLERGDVNPGSSDKGGRTPLSYAAEFGREGVVKIFLERGDVNLDSSDKDGRTPLSYTAEYGHEGVVKMFLARGDIGPDSSDKDGRTPLSYAAEEGNEDVVNIFLERGDVNPESSDKDGRTPLSYAAQSGSERVVKVFLERGDVNPDSSDKDGRTPLSYTAEYGHEGVVKMFLARGDIAPDSSDKDGRTPLSYAAEEGDEDVVNIFLERGDVNPESSDKDGWTPLAYAAESGCEPVVKMLRERKDVNPNSSDGDDRSLPLLTARAGCNSVVGLLSEPGLFSHDTSQDTNATQQISPSTLSAREEVESAPVLQRYRVTPDSGHVITEAIPLSPSAPSSNQLEAPPSAFVLPPMSASGPTSAPDPASLKPPGCLKQCLRATRRLFCRPMRKHTPRVNTLDNASPSHP